MYNRQIMLGLCNRSVIDFKFGVAAAVGVFTTPTTAFDTELEITHCNARTGQKMMHNKIMKLPYRLIF